MKVFCWKSPKGNNFGDELGHLIVERITGKKPQIETNHTWFLQHQPDQRLFTVGSLIEWCLPNNAVWGSGIRSFKWAGHKLDIRAVRGPLTHLYLQDSNTPPEIYGDPALLVPKLFPEIKKNNETPEITIRHVDDNREGIKATMPTFDIIQAIVNTKLVKSSSLHGLILADAYGIPCQWIKDKEPEIKFVDYFLSTGRNDIKPNTLIPPPKLPNLDKLLESFPHDLLV